MTEEVLKGGMLELQRKHGQQGVPGRRLPPQDCQFESCQGGVMRPQLGCDC